MIISEKEDISQIFKNIGEIKERLSSFESNYYDTAGVAMTTSKKPWGTCGNAAAFILLYPHNGKIYTALIKRSQKMSLCPGLIEFPGGTIDFSDTAEETAKREVSEELGIPTAQINTLGELIPSINLESRYWVNMFIGAVPERPKFLLDNNEIDGVIEIPLFKTILKTYEIRKITLSGTNRFIPSFLSENGDIIFGTAAIALGQLHHILFPEINIAKAAA